MEVIQSSLSHCQLKHRNTRFILGLKTPKRPLCIITSIIMLGFIIFFCCSLLPTSECKHPNPFTHKSRQLLHCWTVSKKHIFKDLISVPLSPFQNRACVTARLGQILHRKSHGNSFQFRLFLCVRFFFFVNPLLKTLNWFEQAEKGISNKLVRNSCITHDAVESD